MASDQSTCRIQVSNGYLQVQFLANDTYFSLDRDFYKRPDFTDAYPFDAYIKEKRGTEDNLRDAFSTFWTPADDFVVASDENIAFTMCGGIYTPRVLCQDYLNVLYRILQTTRMKDRWLFSTSVELTTPNESTCSAFELRGSTLFVNSEGLAFDFIRCFSRSNAEAEREGYSIL